MIRDPQVAPDPVSIAGWLLVMREAWWNTATSEDACNALAAHLEADELALALLDEAPVFVAGAEIVLTRIRRSVLLNARWPIYPRLTQALAQQAQLNGGAWPFDEEERVRLGRDACHPFQHAYTPPAPNSLADTNGFVHPTTRAVAQGYERWPYPQWRRVMAPAAPDRLPELVRRLDPGGPDILPLRATILIAGCGTGSEAAQVARDFPDATITAIDLSEASLAYARRQCAALGLPSIRFQRLDLHDVGSLNERFDTIFCSGVLHHLPDPEAGWTKLAGVLRAGGVMRIMLYARAARQWVTQARDRIADLAGRPLDDDLIRQVRRRFLDDPQDPRSLPVLHASAFATLAGTHDLLLHPREDGFDVPRIARSLARLKLRLLTFFPAQWDPKLGIHVT